MGNPPAVPRSIRVLLWFVGMLLLGIMLRKLAVQMMRLDGDISVYYHSSNELTGGVSPYYAGTHYIYPPLFAWLISPFTQLPPVSYAIAWGTLLGLCWVASVQLLRRLTGETGWLADALPSLILFRAIWNGWGHGQVSLLMSVMMLAFLVLERERKLIAATFWLAFAGALKVFPFYMGALLLTRKNALSIPVLGFWTVALSALPALTVGLAELKSLLVDGFLGFGMARINSEHHLVVNHAPMPHLFQVLGIESQPALKVANLACLLLVTALVLIARRPREDRARDNLYLSFVLTSCLIVCPHVWLHYFTLFLLPFAAAIQFIRDNRGSGDAHVLAMGTAIAAAAFNCGSRLFSSESTSRWLDAIGAPSVGLLALWISLAVVVVRRVPAPVRVPVTPDSAPLTGLTDVSLA